VYASRNYRRQRVMCVWIILFWKRSKVEYLNSCFGVSLGVEGNLSRNGEERKIENKTRNTLVYTHTIRSEVCTVVRALTGWSWRRIEFTESGVRSSIRS
jgi:hypothetical protein